MPATVYSASVAVAGGVIRSRATWSVLEVPVAEQMLVQPAWWWDDDRYIRNQANCHR